MPLLYHVAPATAAAAHPVLGHPHVQLPVALIALAAAFFVFAVALTWPQPAPSSAVSAGFDTSSWVGSLSPAHRVGRVVAVVLLGVTIAAGRLGLDNELDNLAPALVVGTAWPLLILASVLAGRVWRWVDPWDGLARVFDRTDGGKGSAHVWPAVVVVLPWLWYLSAYSDPLDPRSVGTLLAIYTTLTVAGCLAVGRQRWLSSAEPLGILLSWLALAPRRRLASWVPPRGAEAFLGIVAGGVLFGVVRRSEIWGGLAARPASATYAAIGLAASCAITGAFLMGMSRLAESSRERPSVARAVVPAIAGIVVAVAMERNRLTNSLQLLPGLLGDPFGHGWDLVSSSATLIDPAPLGATGLVVAQLVVVVLAHLRGAAMLGLPRDDTARAPAATALAVMTAASVAVVATH